MAHTLLTPARWKPLELRLSTARRGSCGSTAHTVSTPGFPSMLLPRSRVVSQGRDGSTSASAVAPAEAMWLLETCSS
eukprot:3695749-Pyramimonas_sp.AAC.1